MSANAMALNTGEVPEFTSTNLILTTTQQLRARNSGHAERTFSQVYCEDVNLVLHRQRMPAQQRHEIYSSASEGPRAIGAAGSGPIPSAPESPVVVWIIE